MRTLWLSAFLFFVGSAQAQVHVWNGTFGWGYWGIYQWPTAFFGNTFQWSTYGAISYSPATGSVGYSHSAVTLVQAQSTAHGYCGVADCRTVVWVQGGCASAAVDQLSGQIGWAYAANRTVAVNAALQACQNRSGANCESLAWTCSF